MKKGLIFLIALFLLIFLSNASALGIRLIEPADGTTNTTSRTIVFECKAFEYPQTENLTNITLMFKIGVVWWPIETKDAVDDVPISFTYDIATDGTYEWNCLGKNDQNQEFFYPQNYTLVIDVEINNPPDIIGTIPDQTKNVNSDPWTLDLTQYEYDQDGDSGPDLDWSVLGVDTSLCNVVVTDMDGDIVTFTPVTDATGSDVITFTLTDTGGLTDSQYVTITINPTSTNTAPEIDCVIRNQTKTVGVDTWELDLEDCAEDDEDDEEDLNWSVSSVDTDLFSVTVDNDEKELTFTAVEGETGSDRIKITLTDTGGLTDYQWINVTIKAAEEDEDEKFDEENNPPEIRSPSPSAKTLTVEEKEKVFRITGKDEDNDKLSYKWYLDGNRIAGETQNAYVLDASTLEENKTYNLSIGVNDGNVTVMRSWSFDISSKAKAPVAEKAVENETLITGAAVAEGLKLGKWTILYVVLIALLIAGLYIYRKRIAVWYKRKFKQKSKEKTEKFEKKIKL